MVFFLKKKRKVPVKDINYYKTSNSAYFNRQPNLVFRPWWFSISKHKFRLGIDFFNHFSCSLRKQSNKSANPWITTYARSTCGVQNSAILCGGIDIRSDIEYNSALIAPCFHNIDTFHDIHSFPDIYVSIRAIAVPMIHWTAIRTSRDSAIFAERITSLLLGSFWIRPIPLIRNLLMKTNGFLSCRC